MKIALKALMSVALAVPAFPAGAPGTEAQAAQTAQTAQATEPKKIRQAKGQMPPPQPVGMKLGPVSELEPQTPQAPQDSDIMFRIGDKVYRDSDFMEYLPIMLSVGRAEQTRRSPQMMAQARKAFADQMLLVAYAEKEGIAKLPEVKKKMDGFAKHVLSQETLRLKGPSMEKDVLQPTDEQVRAHFEQFADTYKTAEKATARHILVSVKAADGKAGGDGQGLSEPEAMARLEKARKELKAGKDWQETAKKYSDDPGSKDKGGLMENFDPSAMVPEFAQAVRTQKIGTVGPPVKTQFGYHMVLVEAYAPVRAQTFDEAKEKVRSQLFRQVRQDAWTSFFDRLKAEMGFSDPRAQDAPPPSPPPLPKGK
jgi:parvulin-like peptidyl-prolyl isomerase